MIKINLALLKSPAGTGGEETSGSGFSLGGLFKKKSGGSDTASSISPSGELPIKPLAYLAIAFFGGEMLIGEIRNEELGVRDAQILKLTEQQTVLQKQLSAVKGLEEVKKKMDSDEAVYKTKISTIEKLLEGRQLPVQILSSVSTTIPEEVWLTQFRFDESTAQLDGVAMNMNHVTDFMRNLGASAHFQDVDGRTGQSSDATLGTEVATFQLTAKRRTSNGL